MKVTALEFTKQRINPLGFRNKICLADNFIKLRNFFFSKRINQVLYVQNTDNVIN